jgi:hypothetical protein
LQAVFCHQLGSLGLCLGRLDDAARLLQRTLAVRERIGDLKGAIFTRQNLQPGRHHHQQLRHVRQRHCGNPGTIREHAGQGAVTITVCETTVVPVPWADGWHAPCRLGAADSRVGEVPGRVQIVRSGGVGVPV